MNSTQHYRAVFLSDTHLGTRDAKTTSLLTFLRHIECDALYLVGDIIDLWTLKTGWYWSAEADECVARIFAMVRDGTQITYIPGNHDDMFRAYCGMDYYGVALRREAIHLGLDGKKYLVLHGDEFDSHIRSNKWQTHIGEGAYDRLLRVNHWFNLSRHHFGFDYWSLSSFLRQQHTLASHYTDKYEQTISMAALKRGMDGVICGHSHHPGQREWNGCLYRNTGDWVENGTALAEDYDGRFQMIQWHNPSSRASPIPSSRKDVVDKPVQAA